MPRSLQCNKPWRHTRKHSIVLQQEIHDNGTGKKTMTNATMTKFGWPETRIGETAHWAIMLRPQQPTLGALVLACKEEVTAFADVSTDAHLDLGRAVKGIETMLARSVEYEKINYLMLMMVDPHVHFHVLPRYQGTRSMGTITIEDAGWPGPPALGTAFTPDRAQKAALVEHLKAHWPA